MALHDSLFETIMHCQRSASLRSKVLETRNLNMLLPEDLDFFIILSSFTGVLRNRDQSNYTAANTYQDALTQQRRELDLTAVTVNLSIMRDTNVLAERGATGYLNEWEIPFGIREEGIPSLNADGWSSPPRRVAKPPPVPAHIITYRVSNRQHRARCGYPTTVLFFFFFFLTIPDSPNLRPHARGAMTQRLRMQLSSVPKPQHSGGHSRSSASHRPRLIRLPRRQEAIIARSGGTVHNRPLRNSMPVRLYVRMGSIRYLQLRWPAGSSKRPRFP